ncbi:hypothetical protein CFIMG_005132RA [Ceratocystis fimbriata CBS 114723]|uniref:PH domain-containing protein n=1 Tax=Ceratocystis fimbriata CBS 114723 TaxID=1035309 RepID=A0A2C5X6H5_9PEZI|nr:hypothetical protein CFIMG_005132RA [Ceratocystis fimbriata CBS 114723]
MSSSPQHNKPPCDVPPSYTCSVECEGIFERKMEIENATKRAEYRNWQTVYVTLVGTALSIYAAKKDRGLGKKGGPSISPDNPPWMKRGKLLHQYSLMHADAGIAADYEKRRYVIRIRAETDQFLISCIELSTFIKWLDGLFSAIDVAAPIEERDFPRDQSIPRTQRIRWLRGAYNSCSENQPRSSPSLQVGQDDNTILNSLISFDPTTDPESRFILEDSEQDFQEENYALENVHVDAAALANTNVVSPRTPSTSANIGPQRMRPPIYNLSIRDPVNYDSSKWAPQHAWTDTHDLIYAKMCYSVLLFRSPRKSPYVISKGTQWKVDWQTGQMTRVLPPQYNKDDTTPWEIIHTQSMRRR